MWRDFVPLPQQLESAYLEKRAYDFEISKTVALRQIAPMALMHLRESGICQFDIPEVLFDADFPGHYFRRIRTVSVTIPCIVGHYTGVNATLSLLNHSYRVLPNGATDANSYPQKPADGPDGPDNRFASSGIPVDSIAVSTAQGDAGVFELSFSSERYLPFEGAGAISSWKLELPQALRSFDYGAIADVLINIKYTSLDGGATLKVAASGSVGKFIQSVENLSLDQGLFAIFDLQAEFSSEWARASAGPTPGADPPSRSIALNNIADRLPFYTRGRMPTAQDVAVITETDLTADAYALQTSPNQDAVTFSQVPDDSLEEARLFRSEEQLACHLRAQGWRGSSSSRMVVLLSLYRRSGLLFVLL
jgi:hypothetical protein